jgi:acetyl esterase/lipase
LKINLGRDLTKEVKDSELRGEGEFNWIEPVSDDLVRGEVKRLADINGVKPMRVPGYWMFRKGWSPSGRMMKAEAGEKVVMHLHGGSYHVCLFYI